MKRLFNRLTHRLAPYVMITLSISLTTASVLHPTQSAQSAIPESQPNITTLWPSTDSLFPSTFSNEEVQDSPNPWIAQFWRRRFRIRSSPYRRGGFSRGPSCPVDGQITALTPFVDENDSPLAGVAPSYLTASSRPHFFFHMPELPATNGILTIQSADTTLNITKRYFHSVEFNVQGQAGIVGVRLSDQAPPLEIGQTYVWSVAVACDPGNIRDSLRGHGGVLERVADVGTGASNRLEAYANQGIWQEPLSILAEQHYANPNDGAIASNWVDLLNSVGLGPSITTAPIVEILNGQ